MCSPGTDSFLRLIAAAMKLLTRTACFAAALLLLAPAAFAQDDGVLTGTIFSADTEETLPGANVILVGTDYGAAADPNGRYEIRDVPAGTYTVRASFIGYETAEVEITIASGETVTQDFMLQAGARELREVVVSGYRVQQAEAATGAVAQVGSEEIEGSISENFGDAVQGRMAGVRITSANGMPGGQIEFDIRGSASINAGDAPLYIIDGVQVSGESEAGGIYFSVSPLSSINPSDIESVRVLKDVAATSIYGAQAANGVVIINTKGGRVGEAQVNFSAQLGAVSNAGGIEVMSAPEYSRFQTRGYLNSYVPYLMSLYGISREAARDAALNGGYFLAGARTLFGDPETVQTTDWQDAVFRTGLTQAYNLSVQGGSEDIRYYVSGSYTDAEGQVIGSAFSRATLRSNLDFSVTDNLEVEARVNLSRMYQDGVVHDGIYINSPLYGSLLIRPDRQIYNERGNPESGFNFDFTSDTFGFNVVAEEALTQDDFTNTQVEGSLALNYQLAPGLLTRTLAGVNFVDTQQEFYNDPRIPQWAAVIGSGFVGGGRTTDYNISQTLNYNDTYAERHDLSTVAGAEYKRQGASDFGFGGQGFTNAGFRNLANAASPTSVSFTETEYRVLSFFGEAEYTFDDRYIVGGTLRTDGSSRFGEENRFGIFGSGSAAWRLSEEAFMEDVEFVNSLKLRASAGVTGNSQIDDFASRFLFSGGGEYFGGPAGGGVRSGFRPAQLGNPDLTWERSEQYNLGLDYSLFGARLSGSFNLYRNNTSNLLLFRPLPIYSGFTSRLENVGSIRSEGIEVSVSTVNLDVGGFRWDTDFNISFQRTEVLELAGGEEAINFGNIRYEVGEPIAQYYYPEYAGVNPDDGRPFFYDENGNLTYLAVEADSRLLGNQEPDFYGGLGNTFSYGGLTLDVFFQFDYGRTVFWDDGLALDSPFLYNKRKMLTEAAWSQSGDVTQYPKPYYFGFSSTDPVPINSRLTFYDSGRWLEDASYIRLKQVRLGYSLPDALTEPAGFQNATLFVQGRNLVTFTNFPGFDPELVGLFDGGNYPQSREITAGLSLSL